MCIRLSVVILCEFFNALLVGWQVGVARLKRQGRALPELGNQAKCAKRFGALTLSLQTGSQWRLKRSGPSDEGREQGCEGRHKSMARNCRQ